MATILRDAYSTVRWVVNETATATANAAAILIPTGRKAMSRMSFVGTPDAIVVWSLRRTGHAKCKHSDEVSQNIGR